MRWECNSIQNKLKRHTEGERGGELMLRIDDVIISGLIKEMTETGKSEGKMLFVNNNQLYEMTVREVGWKHES